MAAERHTARSTRALIFVLLISGVVPHTSLEEPPIERQERQQIPQRGRKPSANNVSHDTLTAQAATADKRTNQLSPHDSLVTSSRQQERFLADTFGVDSKWNSWSSWSPCSETCGKRGTETRTRTCHKPKVQIGGKGCSGSSSETKSCYTNCPYDGRWGHWTAWTSCSLTCGHGSRRRHGSCVGPYFGGRPCHGSSYQYESCYTHCPVDGHWSSWASWSHCSTTVCNHTGLQTRHRTCSNPTPAYGGHVCPNDSAESRTCHHYCPINGHWSSWGRWSSCSTTVCSGTGHQTRHRTCSNPAPKYGGHNCLHSSAESRTCHHYCPVAGHWGAWSSYGACSVTCCSGHQTKTRHCNNPGPKYGGPSCHGSSTYSHSCSNPCKGDAHWSSWGAWSHCSKTCSAGTKSRKRTCANQSVCTGPCSGHDTDTAACDLGACPVDGGWGSWNSYGACSVTCCGGHMTRTRPCNHPAPSNGGAKCPGDASQAKTCTNSCKGDQTWASWSQWSQCSASCAGGTATRSRTCDHMTTCTGSCHGNNTDTTACNQEKCPEWSSWLFTPCSVTCGTGSKQGFRRCSSGHEEDCAGSSLTTQTCVESPCPVDGGWGTWQTWGACSLTCGDGSRTRQRACDNPSPSHGGNSCHGNTTEIGACRVADCPHWGDFYTAGSCSVTCGDGVIQLQRNCSTGNSQDCTGSAYDEEPCSGPAC